MPLDASLPQIPPTLSEHQFESGSHMVAAAPSTFENNAMVEHIATGCIVKEKSPPWIGQKFEPDGRLLPFPGNTIICHLSPDSALYCALLGLDRALKNAEFANLFAFLPPTSWHMTVFEGVSDKIRKPGSWPGDLPLDAPLESCTALFERKLTDFDLCSEPPFRMTLAGFEPLANGIALKVVPVDALEETRLRHLRNRLSDLLQTCHAGHDSYSFHVSLSYTLGFLEPHVHQTVWDFLQGYRSKLPEYFELSAPEFCVFDDMFAFHRRFFLRTQS